MFIHLILLIVAFAANFLAALSGGGAGFIQFPILIFLGLPFALALGTHKVAVVFLGLGTKKKKRHDLNKFDWRMSMLMIFIGCPAVILGTVSIIEVNDSIAKVVLGLLTIGIGIYNIFKKDFGLIETSQPSTPVQWLVSCTALFSIGFFSGSFSSGAGLFATVCLIKFFGFNIRTAIEQSLIWVGGLWNFVGALTMGTFGQINWSSEPALITGAFLGGYIGTYYGNKMKLKWIKLLFIAVSILSGFMLLISAYNP